MAKLTRQRQEEVETASKKRMERQKRIKEAQKRRKEGKTTKPHIKPIVRKTPEDLERESREEKKTLEKVRRDLEKVRKDRKFKVSPDTLDYLLKKKHINGSQHSLYKTVPQHPEERQTITAHGIIENVNESLLFYLSTV